MYSEITSVDLIVNQTTTVVVNVVSASKTTTAGNIVPTETIVYTSPGRNFSTPTIANTVISSSTVFSYKNKLTAPSDTPSVVTTVRNTTNQFANNETYGGYENSVTSKSLISPGALAFSKSISLTQNYSSLSSNVSSYSYNAYTTPGTYTWTVPAGVTNVSLLGVGGGGGGAQKPTGGSGGTGGNLIYYNNYTVTPGETYTIVVGSGGSPGNIFGSYGGDTYITKTGNTIPIVYAAGGYGGDSMYWSDNTVFAYVYDTVNNPTIYTFSAIDAQARTITYSVHSGTLPSGITLNSSTGVLGGDPVDVLVDTNYAFTVSASTSGQTIYKNFTLIVKYSPSATLTISPAISGKTQWNLFLDGSLFISTAATTYTVTPTYSDVTTSLKLWGAGGGGCQGAGGGGGGGYAAGNFTFVYGTSYQIIVGGGGAGTSAGRTAAGGGAGTGMQFTANSQAIIVAGGGGGSAGGASGSFRSAGGGGGSSGQNGVDGDSGFGFSQGGRGGTQSAAGAGGVGSRRTGASGSGRNGGGGSTGSIAAAGGTGFGNGGGGAYNEGDAGSGGGGGGYWGGGEGGGDAGGLGGGGGSGYTHPTLVTNSSNLAGNYAVPANNTDPDRSTAATGGAASSNGSSGIFIIKLQY